MRHLPIIATVLLLAAATGLADGGATTRPQGMSAAEARELFANTQAAAAKAATGAHGVIIWKQFLEIQAEGPVADAARRELAVWQERADKNLVRFGPYWIPADKAAEHSARADELLAEARRTDPPDEAIRLLNEAAKAHPYRMDIPAIKAERAFAAKRLRDFGLALGEILAIDPEQAAARCDLGVLAVNTRDWDGALRNLIKAAEPADRDEILDDLDEVIRMAESAGYDRPLLAQARAQSARTAAAMQQSGMRRGQARWGTQWVSQDQYDTWARENAHFDKQIEDVKSRMAALDKTYRKARWVMDHHDEFRRDLQDRIRRTSIARRKNEYIQQLNDLENAHTQAMEAMPTFKDEAQKLQDELAEVASHKNQPPYARKLYLLGPGGQGILETIDLNPPQPENPGDRKENRPDRRQGQDRPKPNPAKELTLPDGVSPMAEPG